MLRALAIAALTLAACSPRPRGQVGELGHVGDVKQLAVRGNWLYVSVMREAATDRPSMTGPVDIWRFRRSGSAAEKYVPDLPPGVTAFGATAMYLGATDGKVLEIDLASGARKDRGDVGAYIYAIAEVGHAVVVTTETEVIRVDADGKLTRAPSGVVIDRLTSDGTRIAGASIAGGRVLALDETPTPIGAPQNRPTCLGLTATHTFWARDQDGHKSELVGIVRGGSDVWTIAALESSFPTCTAIGDRIYIADERAIRTVVPGQEIRKVTASGWVPALTATEDGVYWVQMIASGWEIRFNRVD